LAVRGEKTIAGKERQRISWTPEEKQVVLDILALHNGNTKETKKALRPIFGKRVLHLGSTLKHWLRGMSLQPDGTYVGVAKRRGRKVILHEFENDVFINLAFVLSDNHVPPGLSDVELAEWRINHAANLAMNRKIKYRTAQRVCEETRSTEPWLSDRHVKLLRFSKGWLADFLRRCAERARMLLKNKGTNGSQGDGVALLHAQVPDTSVDDPLSVYDTCVLRYSPGEPGVGVQDALAIARMQQAAKKRKARTAGETGRHA
jgi:hypothetical protein